MSKSYSLYAFTSVAFLALLLGSLLGIYILVDRHQKDLLEVTIEEKTRLARVLNDTIASPAWAYRISLAPELEKGILAMAQLQDVKYIRIVNKNGVIEQSSYQEEKGKTIQDPAMEQALLSGSPVVKESFLGGEKVKTIVFPGYEDKTVWVGFSLGGIEYASRVAFIRDITLALGSLIFVLLLFFLFLRGILNPIKRITLACQEIRKGNLNARIKINSKNEIGELADTINEMVGNLKKTQDVLEETKTVLEIRVEARTRELKKLTESLDTKVKEKTQELQEKIRDLERFRNLAVGRELKMVELKKELGELKNGIK